MSFTTDVKKEIVNRGITGGGAAKTAAFSAFVRTSGVLGFKDREPTFFLVSETENVANLFVDIFAEVFGAELLVTHATVDRRRGRDKLVLQCPPELAPSVLVELGILHANEKEFLEELSPVLLETEEARLAYLQGAFLGGGSCLLPNERGSGYHLEIVFLHRKTAEDFCELLAEWELLAKLVERKETFVVYVKSKEVISDFLSVLGAERMLTKFSAFVEKRDEANRDNRTRNCMSGNADKAAIAAVKQVLALEKMKAVSGFNDLSEELRTLALARLKNKTMSLKELAQTLGVSKSCLNHRMRKLMELCEEAEE